MAMEWKQFQGQTVNDKYELSALLGESSPGEVQETSVFLTYLDSTRAHKAAIKLFPIEEVKTENLFGSWSVARELEHPHLLRLLDFGEWTYHGRVLAFAVMEFTEENLSMILPSRALTADETCEMLGPILEGLAYIHEKNLVHGHVKPSNILVVDEVVKLSSDGISSSSNRAMLKVDPHLAPEAARGALSPASDVWSLGVTLIEALTQHRPVQLSNGGVSVPASIPMPFRNIAENCLRLDPRQRPTIAEIQRQLNPPTTSAVVPVIEPKAVVKKPAPDSRFPFGIFLAIAVVLAAIIGGLWWRAHSPWITSQNASQTTEATPPPASSR